MFVDHLQLVDFRSYAQVDVALGPGVVVFAGANGQGKTNLLEALGYLATLGSHRVAADAPLIRSGAERAVVRGAVVADDRELRVEVEIAAGRANRARVNGAPVTRVRDVLGILRTVLFAPEDLALVRGDPSERRRFLDDLVVARTPRMAGVRADYDRVLKQRAALLKSAGSRARGAARAGGVEESRRGRVRHRDPAHRHVRAALGFEHAADRVGFRHPRAGVDHAAMGIGRGRRRRLRQRQRAGLALLALALLAVLARLRGSGGARVQHPLLRQDLLDKLALR